MTRKDYIAIAEALKLAMYDDSRDGEKPVEWHEVIQEGVLSAAHFIANAMQDDNPRFDREHFLAVVRGERELTSRPKREPRAFNRRAVLRREREQQAAQLRSWGIPATK